MVDHLREQRQLSLVKMVEFTDGCRSQYKSKMPFADVSFSSTDFGVQFEHHYFGSRHGKGPSDGVAGVVKSAVRRAVIATQAVINWAEDMYNYYKEHLTRNDCNKQRRTFYFGKIGDIERNRPERNVSGTARYKWIACHKRCPARIGGYKKSKLLL